MDILQRDAKIVGWRTYACYKVNKLYRTIAFYAPNSHVPLPLFHEKRQKYQTQCSLCLSVLVFFALVVFALDQVSRSGTITRVSQSFFLLQDYVLYSDNFADAQ